MLKNTIIITTILLYFSGVSIAGGISIIPIDFSSDSPKVSKTLNTGATEPVFKYSHTDETAESAVVRRELPFYRSAALRGDPVAELYLGEAYYDGVGVAKHPLRGMRYLRSAANRGNARAATFLGIIEYLHATDAAGRLRAKSWLYRGAHGGDRLAQRDLGILALSGNGPLADLKATNWLHLSALQGDDLSQRLLGEQDTAITTNAQLFKRGEFWLKEAAKQSDDVALSDLIKLWSQRGRGSVGNGPPKTVMNARALAPSPYAETQLANFYFGRSPASAAIAVELYREAAKGGYAPAAFGLADAYLFGRGVATDQARARQEFLDAALLGDVRAQVNLGTMYYLGLGVRKNLPEAAAQYRIAAKHGSAEGAYYLAKMLQTGQGVTLNTHEAQQFYRIAASRGLAVAQQTLASMPFPQSGARSPAKLRAYWLRRAALSGNAAAARDLAGLYRRGDGVTASRQQALYWLQRSIKNGDRWALVDRALLEATEPTSPTEARLERVALRRLALSGAPGAAFDLGVIYARGINVTRNDHLAVFWWRVGVRRKDPDAIVALGIAYLSGTGVTANESKAATLLMTARALKLDRDRQKLVKHELSILNSGQNYR